MRGPEAAGARRHRLPHNRSSAKLSDAPLSASGFIRPDETNVGLPSVFRELPHRNRDAGVNLFNGRAWWQSRVGKIHSLWIVAQQQNSRHDLSFILRALDG